MNIEKSWIAFRRWEQRHLFLGFIIFVLFSCAAVPLFLGSILYLVWPNGS